MNPLPPPSLSPPPHCAALLARELLRSSGYPGLSPSQLASFQAWMSSVLLPNMDYFVDQVTTIALGRGDRNVYSNWHATIADCMMAAGALADDRPRYDKGVALFRSTMADYFKWGRGAYAAGRLVGEATETLRDVYHTTFGLGSLLQAAETAWGQDLYSEGGHVLAASMELHARIINAGLAKDESMMPAGFKFFSSMPKPPPGCAWKWDGGAQLWSSFNATGGRKCSDLTDGVKYILGITYLPTAWELGYNHFVGRLGMKLPETAALLAAYPVDYALFCWGAATLTHADTATQLWRKGLKKTTLCKSW